MAVKLDMERAYDRVSWPFLRQTLRAFGFPEAFTEWVMMCVLRPSFSILINGNPTEFFHSGRGLRQGCPLSPFLFVLCEDELSRSMARAIQCSELQPYLPGPLGPQLSHLLYADDCLLMVPATVRNASTLVDIVTSYCRASGQRVNLQKSVLCISPSIPTQRRLSLSLQLGIQVISDQITYLGIPITGRRPRARDFSALERRITARLDGWQVSGISMMGRITLLRSILCSLPMYLLANSWIPTVCLRRLERRFRDFLWSSTQGRQGTHLLSWDTICLPIREGGLGLQSLISRREAMLARHASRFLLDPQCLWSTVMRSRYGAWVPRALISAPRGCSFLWRAICQYAPGILEATRWMIGDGRSVDVWWDAWISDLPLARWPTFVCMERELPSTVADFIHSAPPAWHVPTIRRLFGETLACRILSIPLASSSSPDIRLWSRSCLPRAPMAHLMDSLRTPSTGLRDCSWIWHLPVHPRAQLFVWKLAWDRLPTCSLLVSRGSPISPLCPRCGESVESAEHAILTCPRIVGIWEDARSSGWRSSDLSPRLSFLRYIRRRSSSPPPGGALPVYVALQIWLSRNLLVFEAQQTPACQIIRRATVLAREFSVSLPSLYSADPGHWGSPAVSTARRPSAIFVSWEPPPPGFVKVNFDGSVTGRSAGSGFVVRGPEGELLAAGGVGSLESSVPMAELLAAWAGIIHAVRRLGARRLVIEGDSITVIRWIRRDSASGPCLAPPLPLLRDIWTALRLTHRPMIRHVYREANAAADWTAAFASRLSGPWQWSPGDQCPFALSQIVVSDSTGLTHARRR